MLGLFGIPNFVFADPPIDPLVDYFSEPYQIYKIKEQRHQFFIPYLITNSQIVDMSVDCPSRALVIDVEPKNQDGSLIIAVPKGLLDSTYGDEDDVFFIIVDGEEVDSTEIDTNQDVRVIQIPIAKNSSKIEIISAILVSQSDDPKKISPCGTGRTEQSRYYQLLSPLQQEKAGYQPDEVICKEGLELAIKSQRAHHSPLCLKHDTLPILIQRGFAMEIQYAD